MKLQTIEYIGPAPKVKKKRPIFGGWILLLLALGIGGLMLKPLIPFLQAQQSEPNSSNLKQAVLFLNEAGTEGNKLAAAALKRTQEEIDYDLSYYVIDYPNGDIPSHKGKAEDLIIRSFRELGVDLQELVHDHMIKNFRMYPGGPYSPKGNKPDPNNDHRLSPNLQRYFELTCGDALSTGNNSEDYAFGDVVFWHIPNRAPHVGIVVPGPGGLSEQKWVVHNLDSSPKWEDELFSYHIIGHYSYFK